MSSGAAVLAHSANSDGRVHLLDEHLQAVAALAGRFAESFGLADLARWIGLAHDLGKAHPDFQDYLRACMDPSVPSPAHGPDHKTAGAMLALHKRPGVSGLSNASAAAAVIIQGHHGGLKDYAEYRQLLKQLQSFASSPSRPPTSGTPDKLALAAEVLELLRRGRLPDPGPLPTAQLEARSSGGAGAAFASAEDLRDRELLIRLVFSALVDADALDTEAHFSPGRARARHKRPLSMTDLRDRLDAHMARMRAAGDRSRLNEERWRLHQQAREKARRQSPGGIRRLAIPTGGGKTLTALGYALEHASAHDLQRVIIAVPYLTVTEQTAADIRSALNIGGDDGLVVLEHHSAVQDPPDGGWRRRLAAENWDAPVIVTTTVQLFNTLGANTVSRARRLHRLARSVVVIDEAQTIKPGLLEAMLTMFALLGRRSGTTLVLSTATQPALDRIAEQLAAEQARRPATRRSSIRLETIVEQEVEPGGPFDRVRFDWRRETPDGWEQVADEIASHDQAMCVVNLKQHAYELFWALQHRCDSGVYHLSTAMCRAHRQEVLAQVQQRLVSGEPCRLVSTQLIEAGVDIDFPRVWRALAPIPSCIQAAGRCNREGRHNPDESIVTVFPSPDGRTKPYGSEMSAVNDVLDYCRDAGIEPHSAEATHRFFTKVYTLKSTSEAQDARAKLEFKTIAEKMRLIDDDTVPLLVPWRISDTDLQELIAALRDREDPARLREARRRAAALTVNVYVGALAKLRDQIEEVDEHLHVWSGQYHDKVGLRHQSAPDDLVL